MSEWKDGVMKGKKEDDKEREIELKGKWNKGSRWDGRGEYEEGRKNNGGGK